MSTKGIIKYGLRFYYSSIIFVALVQTDFIKAPILNFEISANYSDEPSYVISTEEDITAGRVVHIRTSNVSPSFMDLIKQRYSNSLFIVDNRPLPPSDITIIDQ